MTNIQREVTNFIDHDVSIRRSLARDYINIRALARYIQKKLLLSCSLDAIISAIRRYDLREKETGDVKKRYKLIANAKISSKTRMASVLFKKDMEVREELINLYKKIDFSKGHILRILEVSQYIKIIIDNENLSLVDETFSKKKIISIEKKLGEISIIYDEEVIATPGVFAALASELALNNISIRDGVICGNEHIFIVNEDDLMKALQVLHGITKWGEKVNI